MSVFTRGNPHAGKPCASSACDPDLSQRAIDAICKYHGGAGRHEVAIPHRLFMSWFRPASLTACPPREPPPLFEQEHRNAKERERGTGQIGRLNLDELGLGVGHGRQGGETTWGILVAAGAARGRQLVGGRPRVQR